MIAEVTVVGAAGVGPATVRVQDTGPLPSQGGEIKSSLLQVNAANGMVQAEAGSVSTSGKNEISYSEAFVSRGVINVGGNVITFDALSSWAMAVRFGNDVAGEPAISGKARILNLKINGYAWGDLEANIEPKANQPIYLPLNGGYIVFNEHVTHLGFTDASIMVNVLRVVVHGVADVKVVSTFASIADAP